LFDNSNIFIGVKHQFSIWYCRIWSIWSLKLMKLQNNSSGRKFSITLTCKDWCYWESSTFCYHLKFRYFLDQINWHVQLSLIFTCLVKLIKSVKLVSWWWFFWVIQLCLIDHYHIGAAKSCCIIWRLWETPAPCDYATSAFNTTWCRNGTRLGWVLWWMAFLS
jgi:hypothetical protein